MGNELDTRIENGEDVVELGGEYPPAAEVGAHGLIGGHHVAVKAELPEPKPIEGRVDARPGDQPEWSRVCQDDRHKTNQRKDHRCVARPTPVRQAHNLRFKHLNLYGTHDLDNILGLCRSSLFPTTLFITRQKKADVPRGQWADCHL